MTSVPERLVVDATVAIKWVVGEADSERAASVRGRRLFAPDLLVAECANALWKKVVRRELAADELWVAVRSGRVRPVVIGDAAPEARGRGRLRLGLFAHR